LTVKKVSKYAIALITLAATFALGTTIHVPADQPTIQAAINAAVNGDTVILAAGTYFENIDFLGKAITITSASGKNVTFIDGGHAGPVVTFKSGEGRKSVLKNLTIQNGATTVDGGGVYIYYSSPSVLNNVIRNNAAADGGAGIAVEFSSALVQNNAIINNSQLSGYSGGSGGAISVGGVGSAQVVGNVIQNNTWNSGDGGGMTLFAAGTPTIKNNIISGNGCSQCLLQGGGIWIINSSNALILQNLIYGNIAQQGSGIYAAIPFGNRGPLFINNTIVGGTSSPQGSAVYISGFDDQVQFFNNVLIGPSGLNAVYCDNVYDKTPPTFTNNDVYSPNGTGLLGTCSGQSGSNGNVSADPLFVNVSKNNYRLLGGSAAIDAGDNSAPNLPSLDLAGNPRIINGNDGPSPVIDMGVYEFIPVIISPQTRSFGLQAVGSITTKTVTIANKQNRMLTISSFANPTGYSASGCTSGVAAFGSCNLTITFDPPTVGTFNGNLVITDDAGTSPQQVTLSGSAQ
jgi:parallel beta-helix repeat protein